LTTCPTLTQAVRFFKITSAGLLRDSSPQTCWKWQLAAPIPPESITPDQKVQRTNLPLDQPSDSKDA